MTRAHKTTLKKKSGGFTLVETAIVLMIVGILLGGILVPLSAQMDQRNISDTNRTLSEIKEALIGYAIVYGRLPCPASSTSNGVESPVGGGNCTNFFNGFVPAATLGLTPVDSQGYAIDAWNNRIRYAATSWSSIALGVNYVFTTTNGMSTVGLSLLAPNLLVCSTATGISASSCAAGAALTSSPGVPVVIYSTGKNGGQGSAGTDEAANLDGTNANANRTFVSHTFTPTFDDLVVWVSPNILYNRMVAAGKLP